MRTILILHTTAQEEDAEHAKGVLQEELDSYQVANRYIGKEILQTKNTQFVFRDIDNPAHQKYKVVDKLYISKEIMDDERAKQIEVTGKSDWVWMPTGAIVDYVMDVWDEIPTEKVPRYEIENDKIRLRQVEIYKAHRTGFFETYEEAQQRLDKRLEERSIQETPSEKIRRRKSELTI